MNWSRYTIQVDLGPYDYDMKSVEDILEKHGIGVVYMKRIEKYNYDAHPIKLSSYVEIGLENCYDHMICALLL